MSTLIDNMVETFKSLILSELDMNNSDVQKEIMFFLLLLLLALAVWFFLINNKFYKNKEDKLLKTLDKLYEINKADKIDSLKLNEHLNDYEIALIKGQIDSIEDKSNKSDNYHKYILEKCITDTQEQLKYCQNKNCVLNDIPNTILKFVFSLVKSAIFTLLIVLVFSETYVLDINTKSINDIIYILTTHIMVIIINPLLIVKIIKYLSKQYSKHRTNPYLIFITLAIASMVTFLIYTFSDFISYNSNDYFSHMINSFLVFASLVYIQRLCKKADRRNRVNPVKDFKEVIICFSNLMIIRIIIYYVKMIYEEIISVIKGNNKNE